METKRPPALTSPWKIGFLVSLLLIFLGIGVNYILFRTFNLSWTCFGFDQGKFFFLKNAFFNEMAPIIAIIVFASMVAYFLITAAVRKYKTYLDSGHDYRNLIHVIEEIKDLDDEKVVQRLNKYPKLRDFLKGIRDQVQKKEKALKDRENALNDREKRGMAGGLEQECISLAEAIEGLVRGGDFAGIETTFPELTRIAEAIGTIAKSGISRGGEEDKGKFDEIRGEIGEATKYLKSRLAESSNELQSACTTAQDIERQVSDLNTKLGESDESEIEGSGDVDLIVIHKSLDMFERLSETLTDLGEEAKGVAINTALQAGSGEGALADLIQLAEDVRGVAIKFIDVSQSYQETIDRMRESITVIEGGFVGSKRTIDAGPETTSAISALRSKVSLWVERVIILSDQIKNIEDSVSLSFASIEKRLTAYSMDAADIKKAEDTDEKVANDLLEKAVETASPMDELQVENNVSDLFRSEGGTSSDFSDSVSATQDIPGLEKDTQRIFEGRHDEGGMFDELSKENEVVEKAVDEDPEATFEELPESRPETRKDVSAIIEKSNDYHEDFTEDTMVREPSAEEVERKASALDEASVDEVLDKRVALDCSSGAKPQGEEEEEVIDLYSLGAVDYV